MDQFVRRIYLSELLRQAENALSSIQELNHYLGAPDLPPSSRVPGVLRAVDDFLGDAARMRLMLWPTRRTARERGQVLCGELGLADDHPLRNPTLRHHLEHFDERLDAWAAESPNIFLDHLLGPRNMIDGAGSKNIIRHYVPGEHVYIFRGEEFDIQKLVRAVDELVPVIRRALDEAMLGHQP